MRTTPCADGKPLDGIVSKTVMGMDVDALTTLRQKQRLGTLSASDLSAEAAYRAADANLQTYQGINQAFVSQAALNDAETALRDSKQIHESLRAQSQQSNNTSSNASGGSTHTVNINFGGSTTAINTASAAGAQNLTNFLQQLADAKGRSGG